MNSTEAWKEWSSGVSVQDISVRAAFHEGYSFSSADLTRFKRALVESEGRRAKLEKACEEFRDALDDALGDGMPATRKAMNELYADTIGAALDFTKGGEGE